MNIERNLRPKIHFTPPNMWMNDPNGMYHENGNYHLFYQKNPNDIVHGPMHWGHAVSKDLIHWEHLPIALYPDELGQIFSGSCVYDVNNLSGLGTKENPPVIAMYTSHGDFEQQCIAHSTNHVEFEKYTKNPVIKNTEIQDFRDPKMFYNPVKKGYSCVIAAGDRAMFYFTKDFKQWEKTGEFGPLENINGVWECPDMIPFSVDDKMKWVFLLSPTLDSEGIGLKTFYFVGDFDGDTFVETEVHEKPFCIDVSYDNYAGVLFQNTEKPIFMGWALCWAYANEVPTGGDFRGQMTLARELSLVSVNNKYRLKSKPLGLKQYSINAQKVKNIGAINYETFGMNIQGRGNCKITFSNNYGNEVVIELSDSSFCIDRTKAGLSNFSEKYNNEKYLVQSGERFNIGKIDLQLIFDVSVLEIFCDDGLIAACTTVYPQKPYTLYSVVGDLDVFMYKI